MKRFFLLVILFCAFRAVANDTLTRAQVYNFSVGDTFDYRDYDYAAEGYSPGPYIVTDSSISYSRYLITYVSYSLDSSTKYIQRLNLFPQPGLLDTIVLQNLVSYEMYLDTTFCFTSWGGTITIDSTSQYHGRSLNSIYQFLCLPEFGEMVFVNGLGSVLNAQWSIGCGGCEQVFIDSTILIYYAKGSEIWGTPYYYFPNAVQQLNASNDKIALFPTLNDGTFNVILNDAGLLPVTMMIYDITGQKVEQVLLSNLRSEVNLGPHSTGVYIWKALSGNQLIQTGKMVVH